MGDFNSYLKRNPITRNLLLAVFTFVLFFTLIQMTVFEGFKQGEITGQILSLHQKIYFGRSIGVEDRARFVTDSGDLLVIACKTTCSEDRRVRIIHYKTLFGRDVYVYE